MGNIEKEIISVEVVYARQESQHHFVLEVERGTTVAKAIEASRILELCEELGTIEDINSVDGVGIFGRIVDLETVLDAGDRVELYRPLLIDPKVKRRIKAKEAAKAIKAAKQLLKAGRANTKRADTGVRPYGC